MVGVRNLSYEMRFDVDGHHYEFKYDYSCHYEDVSWISTRGPSWHDRSGKKIRIIGQLSDGSRFAALPLVPSYGNAVTCPDKTEEVKSRLFIEMPNGQVESFDNAGDASALRRVSILGSRIRFIGSALASFEPPESRPRNTQALPNVSRRYYTIWLSEYGKPSGKDPYGLAIQDYINQRKIPWLESGTTFPFTGWSNDDAKFAREYKGALRSAQAKIPLVMDGAPEESWRVETPPGAVRWVAEPVANTATATNAKTPPMISRWVAYNGNQIEVPLQNYYRLFYDQQRERIIEFSVSHVDLW